VHILLLFPGGRQEQALLLAGSPTQMRIMMRGRADAMEFRLREGAWMGESGSAVEIGAIMATESGGGGWMEEMLRLHPRPTLTV
jgi:hypothetical protein